MSERELNLMSDLFDLLWPINRSITGPGLEESLDVVSRYLPLNIERIPSGSVVFDWEVPPEWHLERGRLYDPFGRVVCDSASSNLHVMSYSEPVNIELELDDLQAHLHSLPEIPEAIPYVTSYYERRWGFCLSDDVRKQLIPGRYRAVIESEFIQDGSMPIATAVLDGDSEREVLITSYLCHPSLANNELSGPLALVALFNRISNWERRRYTYRFLLNPETIGALCFLSRHKETIDERMAYGLVLTCLGGPEGRLRYKSSFPESGNLDKVFKAAHTGCVSFQEPIVYEPFSPLGGSDERQYGSPGFRLPVGQICRTEYGKYRGYHNSLDSKDFMDIYQVQKSVGTIEESLMLAEIGGPLLNLKPFGEPQLSKYGLYPSLNSQSTRDKSNDELEDSRSLLNRILQILNLSDGATDLFEICERTGYQISDLIPVVEQLEEVGLLAVQTQSDEK